jgi:hypothetical protein
MIIELEDGIKLRSDDLPIICLSGVGGLRLPKVLKNMI